MCSKEDFYDWSDINLDEILGEYTDDDDMNEESTSSSDSYVYEGESEKPDSVSSKAVKRTTDGEFTFDCPVCRKVLRSVSGFRGHVLKQHPSMDRSDFRESVGCWKVMSCDWHSAPIFVYGTLKQGQANHYLFTDQGSNSYAFLGNAVTMDKWPLVIGTPYNIPFLLDCRGIGNRVTGELYRVNGTLLHWLDKLEGHPGYYTRTVIPVEVIKNTYDVSKTASCVNRYDVNPASEIIQCEVYLLPNFKKDLLKLDYLDCYENSCKKYIPGNARPIDGPSGVSLVKDI